MSADNPGATPEKKEHRRTPPATPAVQAWLDGEAGRDGLASADEQETAAFWTKVNDEAELLRRRKTPIHVQQKILGSLPAEPAKPPARAGSGSVILTPTVAIALGAVLVALGAAIGVLFIAP
ncbi:MAG TPA: hypothetical protein VES88_11595 [Gemmatimonadaceae bacterium]|nr:hypothetical protein [Gemmatimonadaceae bacterium]